MENEKKLMEILNNFEKHKTELSLSRGVYVYGSPGCGKSSFVKNILKCLINGNLNSVSIMINHDQKYHNKLKTY